ncbi:hypothetical protein HELRODRAFT_96072 [Helobdella robusta]|uniref:Superkiller viralicidic activity 2-like 2 n=1 Tax=Helobdella robusta TaxID=6412 RepID=T1G9A1_HELRO|nr:hypothetical protein HELRODRAFT_96072 [Helobdella robusta]ESN92780.1 hypothetical protein HELRODRAFT_96072 [Helobdella robusta]
MPRIQIHRLETLEACTHEVAVPPGITYQPLSLAPDHKPVMEYKFILDPFQKEAILCLENNQSVLVSAHTSAGKTVIALYAVALSLKNKQRVIYTTPIKALSNQKYRELYVEFKDVGLMTGDVTINPDASCLVMTTEILRSMLYRGSEIMREVAWVIFDEIHYMRDKERGVVWEESIILLPDNVHYVFLSATIPNARQFAEWISYLHKQPCHVVYTEYRPTPLQHYIFPAGGDGIHLVVDEKGNFREDNFNTAMSILRDSGDASKGDQKGRKGGIKGCESNCFKIVKMIMNKNFAPIIIFSFSKKDCEAYALQLSKLDFNDDHEKKLVQLIFNNAIDTLSDEDRKLPQIEHVLPLLLKGIGIHHSGLLPILKEVIEIIFAEGLIKALCATETFAMGLNMPARTVLFTNARKFDGKDFRWISSGEYIQMSGRAGRRGLDDKGIVILMLDEKISPEIGKQILKGQPDPLNSAFHLKYNMVLNMLRVEDINPEYMLERSFYQFQNYESIPAIVEKMKRAEELYKCMEFAEEEKVASYYRIKRPLQKLNLEMISYMQKPQYILPFLQPGRLVKVVSEGVDFGWGVVVNFRRKANQTAKASAVEGGPPAEVMYVVDVLLQVSRDSIRPNDVNSIRPCSSNEKAEMQVVPMNLQVISPISSIRIYMPKDLVHVDARMSVLAALKTVLKKFPDGLPLLDPIEDMGIRDDSFIQLVKRIKDFEDRLKNHVIHNSEQVLQLCSKFEEKEKLLQDMKDMKRELKEKKSLLQMVELKKRKRVLRRLKYTDASDVIEVKGRVACLINGADELVATELLFDGVFNNLTAQETCALLSCFAFQEKCSEIPKLSEKLLGLFRKLQDTARMVAKVSDEVRLNVDEDEYVDSFKPNMMNVVYAWANGESFARICQMSEIFEGSIIRCMRRLEECLRQMFLAARSIGSAELEKKFAEGTRLIKRDIIFADSLYL